MCLLITDKKNNNKKNILHWSSNNTENGEISIFSIIEKTPDKYRLKYVEIINNLSEFKFSGKKFSEELNITNSFSSFWSSDFYEKSFYKNPKIINIIKLLALEDYLAENNVKEVKLDLENYSDAESISFLCKQKNINLKKKNNLFKKGLFLISELNKYNLLLILIKFLKFVLVRYSFFRINWTKLNKGNIKNIFFTYSIYSDQEKIKNGNYNSKYWDPLLNKTDIEKESLFFNIYFQKEKKLLINEILNLQKIKSKNKIFFVEQLFDLKIFFKIISAWFKSIKKTISLKPILFKYLKQKNILYLKLYIHKDYFNSFVGLPILANFYYFFIFQRISKKLNNVKKIFYLYENQGWEKIMNFHFNNKCDTLAVNHASIRFWDLRFSQYLNEPENIKPNFYLVNGKDSLNKFLNFGYPEMKIRKVEALRYYDLSKKIKSINLKSKPSNKVLVVSDALEIANKSIASCLNHLNDEIIRHFTFTLKEHPIKKFDYKTKVNLKKSEDDLFNLKKEHDIVIVSNATTAIVDLHLLGYKIICPIGFDTFNLSPLAYNEKILFLSNYSKINEILSNLINNDNNINKKIDFFYFQEDLNFWRSIIKYD